MEQDTSQPSLFEAFFLLSPPFTRLVYVDFKLCRTVTVTLVQCLHSMFLMGTSRYCIISHYQVIAGTKGGTIASVFNCGAALPSNVDKDVVC